MKVREHEIIREGEGGSEASMIDQTSPLCHVKIQPFSHQISTLSHQYADKPLSRSSSDCHAQASLARFNAALLQMLEGHLRPELGETI